MKDKAQARPSRRQKDDDCCKDGSTLTEAAVDVVSGESASMRGGGSKE